MQINIIVFGQLCDVIGETLTLQDITDTNSLITALNERYPELAETKYAIAVNSKVVNGNLTLSNNSTVALLPPFSGG
jgi:molybdopterin synthase sulfur carrier subunit